MAKSEEKKKSVIPACLTAVNGLISQVDRYNNGVFREAPEYLKAKFGELKKDLMEIFKNITTRMVEDPEISQAKVMAAAAALEGVDEDTRKDLLRIAASFDENQMLAPEDIAAAVKDGSFEMVSDGSKLEVQDGAVCMHAHAVIKFKKDGEDRTCTIDAVLPVPSGYLVIDEAEGV